MVMTILNFILNYVYYMHKFGDMCGVNRVVHQTQRLWMRRCTHDTRTTKRDSVPFGS